MSYSVRLVSLGILASFVIVGAACSSSSSDGASQLQDDGGAADDGSSGADGGASNDSGPATVVDSGDGFGASRAACLDEINRLRATQGHAALALWTSPSIDSCVDSQATSDEAANSPHQAWGVTPRAVCDGNGQDECEGAGTDPAGIKTCLDGMWAEKDQANCSGCAACSGAYTPNCPNCDFYGTKGPECGHYVNMSADFFAKVACGFSTSKGGSWATQNFSQ